MLKETVAKIGWCCGRETWPVAFGFSGQGELTDDQRGTANIDQGAVHPVIVIFEDAQFDDFAGQPLALGFAIIAHRAYENDQPMPDLTHNFAVNGDAGAGGSLNQCPHVRSFTIAHRIELLAVKVQPEAQQGSKTGQHSCQKRFILDQPWGSAHSDNTNIMKGSEMPGFSLADAPVRRYRHIDWDSERWFGFVPRAGDIYVCTSYKSGTTWTQMITALLVFQTPTLASPLNELSPWVDLVTDTKDEMHARLAKQTHRRILKTHTPLDGLVWQPDARYLFVARDPRDVFVSLMNHQANTDLEVERALAAEMGQTQTATDMFAETEEERLKDWLTKGYFAWERDGYPYWSALHHGETFWQHRDQPNILALHYSQMKADLAGEMRRIAAFLDIEINEAIFPELVDAASFASMKKKADELAPAADAKLWKDNAQFFSKGTSGQWQNRWSETNLSRFDDLCRTYPNDYIKWLLNGGSID